jgi:hypothetical protein
LETLVNDIEKPIVPPLGTVKPIRDVSDAHVFRFELGPAILAQLLQTLRRVPAMRVKKAIEMGKYPGFYQLVIEGQPVYVGKSSRPVGTRLREHLKKLSGRSGIDLDVVTVKFAFVEDPSLVDLSEDQLISFFAAHGEADWNQSGFGSKVSGYGRGRQKASEWDLKYPSDVERSIELQAFSGTLYAFVRALAKKAPVTVSVPSEHRPSFKRCHPTTVDIEAAAMPFSDWGTVLNERLATGWSIDRQPTAWYLVPSG